jgi:peptide/nickel transport system ATP-binding protein
MAPLLKAHALDAAIGGVQILFKASLTIAPGEIVALVGASGAGKTMLLRCALGLDRPARRISGQRALMGQALDGLSARALRELRGRTVGFVPQNPSGGLDPMQRLGDAWAEAVRLRGLPADPAARRKALAALDLPDCGDLYPHQWSRGMQQRFLIALALLGDPPLLLMDEPTSALDPVVAAAIMSRLADRIRAQGGALVVVTHNTALAEGFADRVVRLAAGRIVEDRPARPQDAARAARCAACPEGPGAAVLDVAGLSVRRGARAVLSDVALHLHAGEALFVLGESGAGKTTLMRALAGLVPFAAERAHVAPLALVLQDPMAALCPAQSVVEAVAEPLIARGLSRAAAFARAAEAAAEVALPASLLDRLPHRLSLGQAQRACIARALVARPKLVLLDEPLSALDPETGAEIIALLGQLRARHRLAFLVVTHDLGFARALADRVAVLKEGRIVEQGTADAFFAAPSSAYGRALVKAARVLGDLERAA